MLAFIPFVIPVIKGKIMKKFNKQKALERLNHIDAHFNSGWLKTNDVQFWDKKLSNIENYKWGFVRLQGYCVLQIMRNWFHCHDIEAVRNYAFNHVRLDYVANQPPYNYLEDIYITNGLWCLLSNHQKLIEWYSNLDKFFGKTANSPKSVDFCKRNFFLALRGDWDSLKQRCETIFNADIKNSVMKTFLPDYEFYFALADGNTEKMQIALYALLDARRFNGRRNWESGYTLDLIYTCVVLYTKLAWYHGYQIHIDSEYIPMEWMDMTPLASYQDEFNFMKNYNI